MSLAHQIVREETTPPAPIRFHEYANLFPMMEGKALDELVEDIRLNGVREPIVMLDGAILDGRNRYMAARQIGAKYPVVEYDGDNPLGYVISLNLRRRHLNESQRAMVAAKLANMPRHRPEKSANLQTSQSEAAEMLSVSTRSVASAATVRDNAVPELQQAVEQGKVSVSAAADLATASDEEQRNIVARGEKEILEAAKAIRAERANKKRAERIERIAEISRGNKTLSTDTRFPIIYADPPWKYENPPMGGSNRSIENHYPTMDLEEICALPVAQLATDDALLYLWATAPKLSECLRVIEAWGFTYRTNFVWIKDKIGMGYHARNQHELVLVAKRGDIPPPPEAARVSSVVHGERGEHSEKPDRFYEIIEAAYPELPKIELFCRRPRDGWVAWGNQSAGAAGAA